MALSFPASGIAPGTQPRTTSLKTATADPGAVSAFNAAMEAGTAEAPPAEATDTQIAELPQAEVQRLRAQWGDDETGFRQEAYRMWQFYENNEEIVLRQILQDGYKQMQELTAKLRWDE